MKFWNTFSNARWRSSAKTAPVRVCWTQYTMIMVFTGRYRFNPAPTSALHRHFLFTSADWGVSRSTSAGYRGGTGSLPLCVARWLARQPCWAVLGWFSRVAHTNRNNNDSNIKQNCWAPAQWLSCYRLPKQPSKLSINPAVTRPL